MPRPGRQPSKSLDLPTTPTQSDVLASESSEERKLVRRQHLSLKNLFSGSKERLLLLRNGIRVRVARYSGRTAPSPASLHLALQLDAHGRPVGRLPEMRIVTA